MRISSASTKGLRERCSREGCSVKPQVYLGRCSSYDPQEVAGVICRGLESLGAREIFRGKVAIKPNVVMAHHVHARHCYTRPEFLDGLLSNVYARREAVSSVSIVEKCGAGASTSVMFRRAGYGPVAGKYGARLCPLEEGPKVRVPLENGKVHTSLELSREMAGSDVLVFAPKLKSNVLAHGMTAALKLNIGSIDDRERMIGHDQNLDEKIVDILEVARPDLIVTDAIEVAVGGNQMTQAGRHLGLIIMATNPVAHDIAAAHVLNLDPRSIGHLRAAWRRGYTPTALDEIELSGDFPLTGIQATTRGWDLGFMRVDAFPSPLRIVCGEPYCTGGCQGAFLDWLHMMKDRRPDRIESFPSLTVVIGEVEGPVEGKNILLIGDCAARSPAMDTRITRIPGCPPTHRDIILSMWLKHSLLGPFVRADMIWDAYAVYPWRRALGWLRRKFAGSADPDQHD